MTLNETIKAGDPGHPQLHIDERREINNLIRHDKYAIYADDYASIQAALDAASAGNIPVVYLNPASVYDVDSTLTIPQGVTLDGGAVSGGSGGAELRATAGLDPMIALDGWYAGVRGCNFNANYQAVVGILIDTVHYSLIEHNWFQRFVAGGAAIKAGGALYTTLRRNIVSNCAGYGLDALNAYSSDSEATYYGINHGLSEQNVWGARMGGIRVEGLLTSVCDDFELHLDGEAAVSVGPISTALYLRTPYFELTKGDAEFLRAVLVQSSGRVAIDGGQFYGDSSAGSICIHGVKGYGLALTNAVIARWDKALSGSIASAMPVLVGGNYFRNCNTISDMTISDADVAMFHVPE